MNALRMLLVPVFLLLTTVLVATAHAKTDPLVGELQATYESLDSFEAKFKQTLKNTATGEEEERSGMFFFKKPELIRWENLKPEEELLVVGKDVVWDYFKDEQVVYKYTVDKVLESKTMIRFISGQARLDQDFYIKRETSPLAGEAKSKLIKLNLVPKEPETQLVQAYVWVDPDTKLLKRILLQDFYGNENEMSFEDIDLNPVLPPELFMFAPPPDAEVFDDTKKQ